MIRLRAEFQYGGATRLFTFQKMIFLVSAQELPYHPNIQRCTALAAVNIIDQMPHMGWDTETTGLSPLDHKPILEAFGNKETQVVIDLRTTSYEDLYTIHSTAATKECTAHNVKFDYKMMLYHYPDLPLPTCWDTMIMAQILYNGHDIGGFSLANLLRKAMKITMSKEVRNSFVGKDDTTPFSLAEILYQADDVGHLPELQRILYKKGTPHHYEDLFALEKKVTKVLAKMELKGFAFDQEAWLTLASKSERLLYDHQLEMDSILNGLSRQFPQLISANLARVRFEGSNPDHYNNYASKDTLIKIFTAVDELRNLPVREDLNEFVAKKAANIRKRKDKNMQVTFSNGVTATQGLLFPVQETEPQLKPSEKYSLDQSGLENYLKNDRNKVSPLREFVKSLLKYREEAKRVSTYGAGFISTLSSDKRARTAFSQAFTATGRLSSASYRIDDTNNREGYNAQNIPAIKEMRHCFKADEGYMMATIDYSGQEIALAASQSQDPLLLRSLNEGLDLHSHLAQSTFRLIKNNLDLIVSKEINAHLRKKHKPILFGLFYGAGPKRIADILDISMELASQVYSNIRDMLPDFFAYQDGIQCQALANKFVHDHSKFGRKRWFTDADVTDKAYKVTKQASNFPMQSSGASMVKEALVLTDEYLDTFRDQYPKIGIVGQVHDEIIFQIPADRLDIAQRCAEIMEQVGNTYLEGAKIKAEMEWKPYWTK